RRSLRGRQISRLVSCVRPLFFGHDLCPDRLSLPVQPIPGGWSWDRTAARWRCTRPHHAPASWTRWRHTAYDRLRPVSCTGASSSVRFSVHRRPCCAPIRCCAPIQGLDIIISYSLKIRKLFSSRSYVSETTYQERITRLKPEAEDILYSREGGILGIACIVPPGIRLCLGQRMMLMRATVTSRYLMHVLNSPQLLSLVAKLTGGSASPHLNVGDVKAFP